MEKEEQLKSEIRALVHLAISNLAPRVASAESKAFDVQSLEAGLSYIGLALEYGERQIARIWSLYEGDKNVAKIAYPQKYELKSDEERRKDAEQMEKLQNAVPSRTFHKQVGIQIAQTLFKNKLPTEIMQQIEKEIMESKVPTSNPDILKADLEAGLVSNETASIGRGYADDEAEKAARDHAERLARIAMAQSSIGIRGVIDTNMAPGESTRAEKKQSQDPTLGKKGRGDGKKQNG